MKSAILRLPSGTRVDLKTLDASASGDYSSKAQAREASAKCVARIADWQERLYAEGQQSVLIVLQAMDTGGKDGAIKRLLTGINPAGVRVHSFGPPSKIERAHDFLWRIHAATPPRGFIGVWNRSHYEDVLIARVHNLVPKKVWRARYEQINEFERILSENGTKILKFYLHISKEEQKERLQARLDNPDKWWKFNPADLDERKKWDDYMEAFEDALSNCSTDWAPWHIVPANHKWARDVALAQTVEAALAEMNPQFPKVEFDPKSIVVE